MEIKFSLSNVDRSIIPIIVQIVTIIVEAWGGQVVVGFPLEMLEIYDANELATATATVD